jgi:hypothetical protein
MNLNGNRGPHYPARTVEVASKRFFQSLRVATLVVLLATLLGCQQLGFRYTSIGALSSSPQMYTDRQVRIQGRVTDVLKLPFLSTRLYSVKDETGEIVVRTEREPPLPGSVVRVKGSLDTVAIIGDQSVGLHLQEIERW